MKGTKKVKPEKKRKCVLYLSVEKNYRKATREFHGFSPNINTYKELELMVEVVN